MRVVVLMLVCVGLILGGCGGDSEKASSPQTVTVVERTVTADDSADEAEPASPADEGSGSSGNIRVPNVVGKDHQLAQDTMQAKGLYSLKEVDATGQDRVLLLDRNWTVVGQSPKAGTKVNEDRTITLRSKKDGE